MKRALQAAALALVALVPVAADVSLASAPERLAMLGLRGRNGKLVFLEAATGRIRWERDVADFGNALWLEQGLVSDRRGIFALGEGANKLIGIDSRRGTAVWETRLDTQQYQALLATDGDRFFASGYLTDRMICVDSRSGNVEWESRANGQLHVVKDRVVAVNYRTGGVSSLERRNGADGWSKTIRGMLLAASGDTIVMTDYNTQRTMALDASTGEQLWSSPQACYNGSIVGDVAVLCDQAGQVRALELAGGKERWTASPALREQRKIVPAGDVILAAGVSSGNISAFDLQTGRELYRLQGGPANNRMPCILATDGRAAFIVNSRENKVEAVEVRSGRVLWEVRSGPAGASSRSPYGVVLTRTLVVVATDGQFLGIEARTGRRVWEAPGPRMNMFYGFVTR
jgi:outer membrane protein assembly factor BamB